MGCRLEISEKSGSSKCAALVQMVYVRNDSPPGQELLGVITSHVPSRHSYTPVKKQATGWRKRRARRPRRCLLKGCEQRFRARQARQRYCSEDCQNAARNWSRCKAQQKCRTTHCGKQKRNGQSRRHRERVKSRERPEIVADNDAGSVITQEHFFRSLLRPTGCYERFAHQRRSANRAPAFCVLRRGKGLPPLAP